MKQSKRAGRVRNARLTADLVTTVSHELRAPLTSIAGSLGLLIGGAAGELPSSATRFLQIAYDNTERLVHLLDSILDPGNIEAKDALVERALVKRGSEIEATECSRHDAATHAALGCIAAGRVRPRVLHVDDDGDVLHLVAEMLREHVDVVSARSIEEARWVIAESDIDLAMIDLALGDANGLDLVPALQDAGGKTIPTIVFSGHDTLSEVMEGVDAVLTKSGASLNRLTAMVRQMASPRGVPGTGGVGADARSLNLAERRRKDVA